ncbi:MAG: hypothetical protein AAF318_20020 [Pseudomonadota bacterium]
MKVGIMGAHAEEAIINEFGSARGHVPERPFMRFTMRENRGLYRRRMRKAAEKILKGELTIDMALERLGREVEDDIKDMIRALATPPNSPATVDTKGSSNPLIDDGTMLAAVTKRRF